MPDAVVHPYGHPVYAWNPWAKPSIVHVSLGADRQVDDPEPMPERHPIGFTLARVVREPLLWEGDDS